MAKNRNRLAKQLEAGIKKRGKGWQLRPCFSCKKMIRFVPWVEETNRRGNMVWHWAYEDGSHDFCRQRFPWDKRPVCGEEDYVNELDQLSIEHIKDIVLRG